MRAGLVLLSCLAFATNASAQIDIADAPAAPAGLWPGSLVVSADPASCLVPSTLSVAGVAPTGSSTGIGSRQTGACRWVITGLGAGSYEIGLTNARGSGGRVRFDYVPGQLSELRIPAPPVNVTGVVRINGQPVSGATIMFMTRPIQNGLPRVVSDKEGAFEASLPEAGEVSMRLMGGDVYGQGVKPTFSAGANRYDWDITGGTLVIRDPRGPRALRFELGVWHEGGFQGVQLNGTSQVLRGAPFGTHTISIRRGSAPAETITAVTLSPDAPRAEAVIDVP